MTGVHADLGPLTEAIRALSARVTAHLESASGDAEPRVLRQAAEIRSAAEALCADVHAYRPGVDDPSGFRHHVRNALGHVAGPAQLALRRLEDAEAVALLERVLAQVAACAALLDTSQQGGAAEPAPAVSDARAAAAGAHILVAEDDGRNRQFLSEVLSAEGHTVEFAGDGDSALRMAQRDDFDLVLLDLGLPGITGFEILERLQADGWRTPVVVVTGRGGVDDAVRCIQHGADDFLTKPIEVEILRARIASCVETLRVREREIGQFFPPKLARTFARRPTLIDSLPGKHANVSVLFCDIRNFTAISERLGPEQTTRWLRDVMNELSECVSRNEGVLVDFAGDEMMAMWGAPEEIANHATLATDTAVEILQRLPAISTRWHGCIGEATDLAIGVNSGRAMVGHIGTARRTKYGALGDAVNIGSRVLGATRHLRTRLLITGATRDAIEPGWRTGALRRLGRVRVVNVNQAIDLYEVQPAADSVDRRGLLASYEQALEDFERGAFRQSAAALGQLLVDYPDDGPTLVLMSRVVDAMLGDPDSFDPVWQLRGK